MIWFCKLILNLIFQKQPSCARNMCTEHQRKLPKLTVFFEILLFLKIDDSVEHVYKFLLIVLFINYQGEIKFSQCIWLICLF